MTAHAGPDRTGGTASGRAPLSPVKGHRWFAAVYDWMTWRSESTFMKGIRRQLLGGPRGHVLEVGAGTGANFPYYRSCGHRYPVVATEPDAHMLKRARRRLAKLGLHIDLHQARAEQLPFADGSFDTVICSLALCTVQDPDRSLAEIHRVLKPGGEFRFYEHVRSANRFEAFMQDIMKPLWKWLGAGCHPNRDITVAVEQAGFRIVELRRSNPFLPIPFLAPTRPHVLGAAQPAELGQQASGPQPPGARRTRRRDSDEDP
jgi:ubiquinone/menaquinone biosynthesis C-methylase UbiE